MTHSRDIGRMFLTLYPHKYITKQRIACFSDQDFLWGSSFNCGKRNPTAMNTILFIHGTGTRDPHFSKMLEQVDEALGEHALVQPCYWGECEGSRLNAGGASIPSSDSTRSIREVWHAAEP